MPFTLAHPAASIPLARLLGRYAPLSALIVGSMVPDIVLFVPLGPLRDQTHSLGAVVWFAVPVGLAVLLVYHAILKRPLVALMPDTLRAKLAPYARSHCVFGRMNLPGVVIGLSLGAMTHIAWDAFTHATGPVAGNVPMFGKTAFSITGTPIRVFSLLQIGSTVLGLTLLAYWCRQWLQRAPAVQTFTLPSLSPKQRVLLVGLLLAIPAVVGMTISASVTPRTLTYDAVRVFVGRTVVFGGRAFGVVLLLYGFSVTLAGLQAARAALRE